MGKTVVIIPLGTGSMWDNNELRFALRSLDKHLSGFTDVFIVGDPVPSWLKKVIHVPVGDVTKYPAMNTLHKVKACLKFACCDHFLLTYDDVFLNKGFVAGKFPHYYNGDLSHFMKLKDDYKKSCMITYQVLFRLGYSTKKFGLHCPFLFNTETFLQVMDRFKNFSPIEPGFLYKSLYANVTGVQAEFKRDIIVNLPLNLPGKIETLPFYSVRPGKLNDEMKNFFQEQFPNKSRFEK
jgi:hypothetical protein